MLPERPHPAVGRKEEPEEESEEDSAGETAEDSSEQEDAEETEELECLEEVIRVNVHLRADVLPRAAVAMLIERPHPAADERLNPRKNRKETPQKRLRKTRPNKKTRKKRKSWNA